MGVTDGQLKPWEKYLLNTNNSPIKLQNGK